MSILKDHDVWNILDIIDSSSRSSENDDIIIGETLPNIKEKYIMEREKVGKLRRSFTMGRLRRITKQNV
jgi:hypothetical protein